MKLKPMLIDLDKVFNDLDDKYTFGEISRELHDDIYNYLYYCTKPVDAEPVRHGKWIHHPEIGYGETWLCSECRERTTSTVMGIPRYNYCPMCGAKMEIGEAE